jgi:four helix bundle protein
LRAANGEQKLTGAKHYRELLVWQKSMELAEFCYQVTRSFPREELFGLVSQVRRAAVSVPANIAEGQARGPGKEFAHFLRVARGSLAELETHLLLCRRVGLLSEEHQEAALALADEIGRLLRGLQKSIRDMSCEPEDSASVNSQLITHNS